MSDPTTTTYRHMVDAYRAQVDDSEQWKRDHEDAMFCRKLESVLEYGNTIYDIFCDADQIWRTEYLDGRHNNDLSDAFDAVFDWWLEPCARVEKMIQLCEAKGFKVERADEFRARHARALSAKEDR